MCVVVIVTHDMSEITMNRVQWAEDRLWNVRGFCHDFADAVLV